MYCFEHLQRNKEGAWVGGQRGVGVTKQRVKQLPGVQGAGCVGVCYNPCAFLYICLFIIKFWGKNRCSDVAQLPFWLQLSLLLGRWCRYHLGPAPLGAPGLLGLPRVRRPPRLTALPGRALSLGRSPWTCAWLPSPHTVVLAWLDCHPCRLS